MRVLLFVAILLRVRHLPLVMRLACRLLLLMNRRLILSTCHLQLLPVSLLPVLIFLVAQLLLPLILVAV